MASKAAAKDSPDTKRTSPVSEEGSGSGSGEDEDEDDEEAEEEDVGDEDEDEDGGSDGAGEIVLDSTAESFFADEGPSEEGVSEPAIITEADVEIGWRGMFARAKDKWDYTNNDPKVPSSSGRGLFWDSGTGFCFEWDTLSGTLFQYYEDDGAAAAWPVWNRADPETHKWIWESLPAPVEELKNSRDIVPLVPQVAIRIRDMIREKIFSGSCFMSSRVSGHSQMINAVMRKIEADFADQNQFLDESALKLALRQFIGVHTYEMPDVQVVALAHELDPDDQGAVPLSSLKRFLEEDIQPRKRHHYSSQHSPVPKLVQGDNDPKMKAPCKVMKNPNALSGSLAVMRLQKRLHIQAEDARVSALNLLHLQMKLRRLLLKYCSQDNTLRRWRDINSLRLLLSSFVTGPAGEHGHLGTATYKDVRKKLREYCRISIDMFTEKELNHVLLGLDGEDTGLISIEHLAEFVQMPLMQFKLNQAKIKTAALTKDGARWVAKIQKTPTLYPGYLTLADFTMMIRRVYGILVKDFPACDIRLTYDALNNTNAAAITLADFVEWVSDGQLLFSVIPPRLPTAEELKDANEEVLDEHEIALGELMGGLHMTQDEADRMLAETEKLKATKMAVLDRYKLSAKAMSKNSGPKENSKIGEVLDQLSSITWNQECERDLRYVQANLKGAMYKRGKIENDGDIIDREGVKNGFFIQHPRKQRIEKKPGETCRDAQSGLLFEMPGRKRSQSASAPSRRSVEADAVQEEVFDLGDPAVTKDDMKPWNKIATPVHKQEFGDFGPVVPLKPPIRLRWGDPDRPEMKAAPAWRDHRATSNGRIGEGHRRKSSMRAWAWNADPSMAAAGVAGMVQPEGVAPEFVLPFGQLKPTDFTKKSCSGYSGYIPQAKFVVEHGHTTKKQVALAQMAALPRYQTVALADTSQKRSKSMSPWFTSSKFMARMDT